MAAVAGEYVPELSRHHTMIASTSRQHQQQHSHNSSPYRTTTTRARRPSAQRLERSDLASPYHSSGLATTTTTTTTTSRAPPITSSSAGHDDETHVSGGGVSRIPSPPSSSPSVANGPAVADDGNRVSMASQLRDSVPFGQATAAHPSVSHPASAQSPTTRGGQQQQQPSPPSDDFTIPAATPAASYLAPESTASSSAAQQTVIHVRDLAHVQSLARAELMNGSGAGMINDPPLQQTKYEISAMPIGDIIEMVAALLTKITTTNDLQHDAMSRNVTHQQQANQTGDGGGGSQMSPLSHSVLAFHGKNVPAITILSYLSRIHKYCPTTFEVFLSLLVYFDRMTERVNDLVTKSEEARRRASTASSRHPSAPPDPQPPQQPRQQQPQQADAAMRDEGDSAANSDDESDSDLADSDDEMGETPAEPPRPDSSRIITVPEEQPTVNGPATYFVVDSFNIHRLIIAGITCASKFFSDVFYTNSRYAKVGGLPLAELNHLEIQFLVLNDFRLAVPVEDLEAYATMLVEFYAREVVAQRAIPESSE